MAKVRFKAEQVPTGKHGYILLKLPILNEEEKDDPVRRHEYKKIGNFLKQKEKQEKERGKKFSIWVEFETYYKKATPSQWRLFQMLVRRVADRDGVDYTDIYKGIRKNYFPKENDDITPKEADYLTTVDVAKIIEGFVAEISSRPDPVDISDIWVLWKDFRHNKSNDDPLSETYKDKEDYIEKNPICEICGKGLIETEAPDGTKQREGQIMHIVTGGPDIPDNWFRGCTDCHILFQHQKGWPPVIEMYPHIKGKVVNAFTKYSKPPTEQGDLFGEEENAATK